MDLCRLRRGAALLAMLGTFAAHSVTAVIALVTLSYGIVGSVNAVLYLYTPEIYPRACARWAREPPPAGCGSHPRPARYLSVISWPRAEPRQSF
jgi:hypothetical protein